MTERTFKLHRVVIYYDNVPSVFHRQHKSTADFDFNRGVSLVNRGAATKVEWYLPNGKLFKGKA